MILYLLKSAICLALLLAFYHLVLEKEKMHNFNRYYLLGSVVFSFLSPLYIIYIDVTPVVLEATKEVFQFNPTEITTLKVITQEPINYTNIFTSIYLLISSILLIRFGKNLIHIILKIRKNKHINYQNAKLVLVVDKILPHTFWKYIFINKGDYENKNIEKELFTHELTHVTQKHTLDVLILELIQVIFWINPFFILLKRAIQLNHEFLADEKVINQHKNTFQYQHLLLNKAAWKNEYYLASNLNYSLTKKRLLMMTTQSSRTKILLKKLAVIPVLAGFIFLFAERVEAQKVKEIKVKPLNVIYEEGLKKQLKYIDKKYIYHDGLFTFENKNGKKITKKYDDLTLEEKKRIISHPPLKYKKKVPTQELIEKLKDGKKYAIWIDGKVVKNRILNNYKNSDFSSHFVSFVYKNARSKRFPQNYQVHLETHKYFEAQNLKRVKEFEVYKKEQKLFQKAKWQKLPKGKKIKIIEDENFQKTRLSKYILMNKVFESQRNSKPHFIKSNKKRQNLLQKNFSSLGSLYFNLSNEDKKKTKKPINPQHPYLKLMRNNIVFYKLRNELTDEDKLLIPPPPPHPNASEKEISKSKEAYASWKKQTGNNIPPPPPPISPLDHVIKMAKKDATFYFETKEITSDKAIELLKKNKHLNIDTRSKDIKNPVVRISNKIITIKGNDTDKKGEPTYYLDGKIISKKEMEKMSPDNIKSIDVKKNKNGSGSIYITSKKE